MTLQHLYIGMLFLAVIFENVGDDYPTVKRPFHIIALTLLFSSLAVILLHGLFQT